MQFVNFKFSFYWSNFDGRNFNSIIVSLLQVLGISIAIEKQLHYVTNEQTHKCIYN